MSAAEAFPADINRFAPAHGNVVVGDLPDDGRLRPKKRQRHEDTTHHRQKILVQLRRGKNLHSNTPQNKSWLKDFVHETWPFTKRDSLAHARKRQYCYNLILQKKNSSLVDDQEDRQSTECEQSQQRTHNCLQDLPPGRGGPRKTRGLKRGGRSAAVKALPSPGSSLTSGCWRPASTRSSTATSPPSMLSSGFLSHL